MSYRIFSTTLVPDSWYVSPIVGWTTVLGDATTYSTEQAALDVIAMYGMFAIAVNNPAGISGDVVGPASSATGNLAGFADATGKLIADSLISPTTITAAIAAAGTGFVTGPASSATGNALSFFGGTGKVAKDSGLKIVAPGGTADFAGFKLTLTANSWIGGTAATGAAAAFSGARVMNSTAVTLTASSSTKVPFNNERYDVSGYHDNVTNNTRLTAPSAGYYNVGACINLQGGPSLLTEIPIVILLNNATVIGETRYTPSTADATNAIVLVSCDYQLSQNDYVEVRVTNGGFADYTSQVSPNSSPEFWIHKIG